jgi:hypothetical protein
MTTKKISELVELTTAENSDVLLINDVSANQTKKIAVSNLFNGTTLVVTGSFKGNLDGNAATATNAGNADLLDNLDSTAFARLSVSNIFAANQVITGSVSATAGFSGSLTKLTDGSNYLLAGANIVLSTGSNGAVTINGSVSATTYTGSYTVYVDSVGGADSPGNGTLSAPFRTINYAYSQVPSLGDLTNVGNIASGSYNANVEKFITQKLIIKVAPGRYVEDVTLGFKRARVALVGNGVQIVGNVKMSVKRADFPSLFMEGMKNVFPTPWTSGSAQNTFEIVGGGAATGPDDSDEGGGVEADATAVSIVVTGLTSLAFEEPTILGFGALYSDPTIGQTSWETHYGQFNFYANKVNLMGGMVLATSYTDPTVKGLCTTTVEVDSCTIGEAASPFRTYFGAVPYAYLASPLTWNTTNNGTTNRAPTGTVTCKVHNSTMGAALGPSLVIGEMDGCRIYDIDRSMRGTVVSASVAGSTSTSYAGFVNNQFRVYSGAGIPTSSYQLGGSSGTTRYKMDSVSYTTLAFNRNSSGVLSARTLNTGSGVSYDFLDEARSLAYTPVSGSNTAWWLAPAPTTVASTLDRLTVAVKSLLGTGSIPRA